MTLISIFFSIDQGDEIKLEKKYELFILYHKTEWLLETMAIILESSIVVVTKDQVSCDLSGEAAILNLKSGVYFGLNTVGASIWNLIQKPRTVKEIQDSILKEYDVDSGRCEQDILEILQELSTHGLIEIVNEKNT